MATEPSPDGLRSNGGVFGIGVDEIVDEYERRSVSTWSDVEVGAAVGDVVQQSRAGPFDSFVLHAPLETAARSALLAQVRPSVRRMSRLRMMSIAAQYEAFAPAAPEPVQPASDDPVGDLVDAVRNGDSEASAIAVASSLTRSEVIAALTEFVIPLTSAAAHSPIFLHLLQRSDPRGPITPRLLAPLSRELARGTGRVIHWVDDWAGSTPTDTGALEQALMTTPTQRVDSTSIHPIMESVDTSGMARRLLDDTVGTFDRRSAATILRVAAMSMIYDTPDEAPYGWTHCLTLPQAVIEIAHASARPDVALAVAATHVVGFRAAFGETGLPDRPLDSYPAVDMAEIVDVAASHHDAHVVKYTLACLDAAAFDPDARNLYHSAAAHLLGVWSTRTVDDDPLAEDAHLDGPGEL